MRAGSLRHSADIQKRRRSGVGDSGVPLRSHGYALDQTRRVAIEPLSGREALEAQQILGRTMSRIRMRYYEDLNSEDYRIVVGSRTFDIHAVTHTDERRRETVAMVYETSRAGAV